MDRPQERSRSRFAHFYGNNSEGAKVHGIQDNAPSGNGDRIVSAGIVFRTQSDGRDPEVTGSFVSAMMDGEGRLASVGTSVVRPDRVGGDRIANAIYQRTGEVLGHVTFCGPQEFNGVLLGMQKDGSMNNLDHKKPHRFPLPDPSLFKIRVRSSYAPCNYDFNVKATYSLMSLKKMIAEKFYVATDWQILALNRERLKGNDTLISYGIREGSVIILDQMGYCSWL